jgi:hypothetical protein
LWGLYWQLRAASNERDLHYVLLKGVDTYT